MLNLTEVEGMVVGQGLGSHRSHSLILLLMMINLTEVDGMVVGHVRVLRVLRFPKLTQIQQDSTKNNL